MKRPALEKYRIWLAAAVLAVALLAGWWANRTTEPEAPPLPATSPSPAGTPPAKPARPLPPAQKAEEAPAAPEKIVDIFAVRTWEPPPPPLAAATQQQQAPPLPFRFMGRIAEPGQPQVFLLVQGDRVLPVKLGDRIGGAYRLEKSEGGQLFFRYRPMNVVQTLSVGTNTP